MFRVTKATSESSQLLNTNENRQFKICCIFVVRHAILTLQSMVLQTENVHLAEAILLAQYFAKELKA